MKRVASPTIVQPKSAKKFKQHQAREGIWLRLPADIQRLIVFEFLVGKIPAKMSFRNLIQLYLSFSSIISVDKVTRNEVFNWDRIIKPIIKRVQLPVSRIPIKDCASHGEFLQEMLSLRGRVKKWSALIRLHCPRRSTSNKTSAVAFQQLFDVQIPKMILPSSLVPIRCHHLAWVVSAFNVDPKPLSERLHERKEKFETSVTRSIIRLQRDFEHRRRWFQIRKKNLERRIQTIRKGHQIHFENDVKEIMSELNQRDLTKWFDWKRKHLAARNVKDDARSTKAAKTLVNTYKSRTETQVRIYKSQFTREHLLLTRYFQLSEAQDDSTFQCWLNEQERRFAAALAIVEHHDWSQDE